MAKQGLNIAVLSGKGGAGKTFVALNLAVQIAPCHYYDCDVEAPNAHLYLKPKQIKTAEVSQFLPVISSASCTGCRKCVDFCQFNALAFSLDQVIVFDDLCHACGGCARVCPTGAISECATRIGQIDSANCGDITLNTGYLDIGQVSGVPVIGQMLDQLASITADAIIDCPPGSACTVMESIQNADFCLLVGESSVYGAHNLKTVHQLVKLYNKPHGVIINKYMCDADPVGDYCRAENCAIIARILHDDQLAKINAQGQLAANKLPHYASLFSNIYQIIRRAVM